MKQFVYFLPNLICTLIISLPQGWCCLFSSLAPVPQTIEETYSQPTKKTGCDMCKAHQAPAGEQKKTSDPEPVGHGKCHCSERETAANPSPQRIAVDLDLPPMFTFSAVSDLASSSVIWFAALPVLDDPPLQLLHCLWLC